MAQSGWDWAQAVTAELACHGQCPGCWRTTGVLAIRAHENHSRFWSGDREHLSNLNQALAT